MLTRLERRLSALASSRGTRPAQDSKCPAVGNGLMGKTAHRMTGLAAGAQPQARHYLILVHIQTGAAPMHGLHRHLPQARPA